MSRYPRNLSELIEIGGYYEQICYVPELRS